MQLQSVPKVFNPSSCLTPSPLSDLLHPFASADPDFLFPPLSLRLPPFRLSSSFSVKFILSAVCCPWSQRPRRSVRFGPFAPCFVAPRSLSFRPAKTWTRNLDSSSLRSSASPPPSPSFSYGRLLWPFTPVALLHMSPCSYPSLPFRLIHWIFVPVLSASLLSSRLSDTFFLFPLSGYET